MPQATVVKGTIMLRYAAVFLIVALCAAPFGFGAMAIGFAEFLFFVFLVLFAGSVIWVLTKREL
jgi:uncharacterized membrane protein YtjA (UPF0391 family)